MRLNAVVLHDALAAVGAPDAVDVLYQVRFLTGLLAELDWRSTVLPADLDLSALEQSLTALEPGVVVNLVESLNGRGDLIHLVPALLESLDLPFTGCSAQAQALTSNKLAAKRRLRTAGIPTPAVFSAELGATGPWIVKSIWEHASLGLDDNSLVGSTADVPARLQDRRARFGGQWFAEQYIDGRELNVAVIASPRGPLALPVAEICFTGLPAGKPRIVGYAAKWDVSSDEYLHTPRSFMLEPQLAAQAAEIALSCWQEFELSGYARVDFRVDAGGGLWVLEINANPCLSPDAGFAAMLKQAAIPEAQAMRWLIDDALRRGRAAASV